MSSWRSVTRQVQAPCESERREGFKGTKGIRGVLESVRCPTVAGGFLLSVSSQSEVPSSDLFSQHQADFSCSVTKSQERLIP
jgi:hypothetical protein